VLSIFRRKLSRTVLNLSIDYLDRIITKSVVSHVVSARTLEEMDLDIAESATPIAAVNELIFALENVRKALYGNECRK